MFPQGEALGGAGRKLLARAAADLAEAAERVHIFEDSTHSITHEDVERLRERLHQLKAGEAEAKSELEKARTVRMARESRLREELAVKSYQAMTLREKILELERRIKHGPPPPGPSCLAFVDGYVFLGLASVVIIANLVVMTFQVLVFDEPPWWSGYANTGFLTFYIAELSLKAMYYQNQLLCGPPSVVWWNWLDAIIVVSGVIDRWILPLLVQNSEEGPSYISYFRVLRLARLARLLKLVKIFMQSDLSWTDGTAFQSFIMGVISFNAILMGFETQFPAYENTWFITEQTLLLIFTFELVLRLKKSGCRGYFANPTDFAWNWLDFVIVVGGMVDQWLMPSIGVILKFAGASDSSASGITNSLGQVMSMLRMARLLRILRLARLIKNIPPLYKLVVGIATAMQGMAWVMVLTTMVLYICALVGVRVAGPDGLLWGDEPPAADVQAAFPDIYGAIFNLFKVMNADMSPMEGLFKTEPLSKLIIGVFVVITNWAIFSIMTAVVSDNMARVTQATDEEAEAEGARSKHERFVCTIFEKLDSNADGTISGEALQRLTADDSEVEDLCVICDMSPEGLREFVDIVLHNAAKTTSGVVDKELLLKALDSEQNAINQRCMMRINKKMDHMEDRLTANLGGLEDVLAKGVAKIRASGGRT